MNKNRDNIDEQLKLYSACDYTLYAVTVVHRDFAVGRSKEEVRDMYEDILDIHKLRNSAKVSICEAISPDGELCDLGHNDINKTPLFVEDVFSGLTIQDIFNSFRKKNGICG